MKPSNLHNYGQDGFDGIAVKLTNNGHSSSSERCGKSSTDWRGKFNRLRTSSLRTASQPFSLI